jgi:hypothetical protein
MQLGRAFPAIPGHSPPAHPLMPLVGWLRREEVMGVGFLHRETRGLPDVSLAGHSFSRARG